MKALFMCYIVGEAEAEMLITKTGKKGMNGLCSAIRKNINKNMIPGVPRSQKCSHQTYSIKLNIRM